MHILILLIHMHSMHTVVLATNININNNITMHIHRVILCIISITTPLVASSRLVNMAHTYYYSCSSSYSYYSRVCIQVCIVSILARVLASRQTVLQLCILLE